MMCGGGFRVGKRATCKLIIDQSDHIEVLVTNYGGNAIQHKRSFLIQATQLLIRDELSGKTKLLEGSRGSLQFSDEVFVDVQKKSIHLEGVTITTSDTVFEQVSSSFANRFHQLKPAVRIIYPILKTTELQFQFS